MKVIPYEAAHMDLFEQRPEDIKRYGKFSSENEFQMAKFGTCFTVIIDGRIVLMGGILQVSVHTGHCWTMVSTYAPGHGIQLFRALKRHLEAMMRDMKLHRIETSNQADAAEHHKWCKLLGFQEEGLMRYYDDEKRDYIRFAKYMEG